MSTVAVLSDTRIEYSAFSAEYPATETGHDLVYHPGVIPPLASSALTARLYVERQLGETEVSYFLPSRESGVNDMYLHLGCRAPPHLVERRRVVSVWAIMRMRHPLLAAKVKMNAYDDISFAYEAPLSPFEALEMAERNSEYREQDIHELIDSHLNGPRILSNERLAFLVVSTSTTDPPAGSDTDQNADFMICAAHFLGDGMALHQFANDFFALLGSSLDQDGLASVLAAEWLSRCATKMTLTLPSALEDRFPSAPGGKFKRLASRVDYDLGQQKLIGGHSFPRRSGGPRRTVVPTISLAPDVTEAIISNCKSHGVSISAAIFAICNIAWARTKSTGLEYPIMMYSALNMRPNLRAEKRLNASYWFLAIGYFNVVLPSFFPSSADPCRMFWLRARSAKAQIAAATRSPMNVSRCKLMAADRGARARVWAKEDDDKLAGVAKAAPAVTNTREPPTRLRPSAPSTALMGLSLLGNLDGIYKHERYPAIELHTLTTGSRQRAGGMLLFCYTFVGRLWISFGYDQNGFEEAVVDTFWNNVQDAVQEFLVQA